MKTFSEFGIEIPFGKTSGQIKTLCPHCHDTRTDKKDKSLSVNLDKGIWHCHYCEWKGSLHIGERAHSAVPKVYQKPAPLTISGFSDPLLEWFEGRGITKQTLTTLKVGEGFHYMPQASGHVNTIQFNFYLNGELINRKYRSANKKFAFEAGAELIPYNIDSIVGQKECIITEGEIDCLSFVEAGFPHCISVPNGANTNLSYFDDFIDGWFEDKETIYIAVDTDQKGVELREELIRRFGAERCRIVSYGTDCKDANEHLVKYGKASLRDCITKSSEIKIEGIFTVDDFEDSLDALFEKGMPRGVTIGIPTFDKLCSFETKRLALVTGIPGSGKSEFLDEIAERLNIKYGWKFAFFSPENAPTEYHASKLIEKLTGKSFRTSSLTKEAYIQAKNHVRENFFFINPKDDFTVESILDKAKHLIRRYGIKALVIDPYNRLDLGSSKSKETDVVREMLRTLTVFAQQNDVLIFLMAHPTKQQKTKDGEVVPLTLYDIAGSAHFFNMADYGIIISRDKVEETVEVGVRKVRFKHLGTVGKVLLKYNVNNGRYVEHVKDQPTAWDNSNHLRSSTQYSMCHTFASTPAATPSFNPGAIMAADAASLQPMLTMSNSRNLVMGASSPSLFSPEDLPMPVPQHYDI